MPRRPAVRVNALTEFDLNNNNFAAMAQEQASSTASSSSSNQTEIVVAQTPEEQANLDRFDRLDFEAWNNRNWTLFEELHGPDVLVVDFTGNTTRILTNIYSGQWEQHLLNQRVEYWLIPLKLLQATGQL
jgi:hypothetical protein